MAGVRVTEHLPKMNASYPIDVDSDHKATEIKLFSLSSPHMRAFHLAWLSLFSCFFSTFSIPPLLPLIKKDLNLTASDVGKAGIATFLGSIFSRLAMGPACDLVGPRIASATLSLLTAPLVLCMCFIKSPVDFMIVRFLIGFSIANFVANQFWMSCMFSSCVVGLANGLAAGWANVGSGVTQLVMPLIYSFFITTLRVPAASSSIAWRMAFVVPAAFQAVTALLVLVFGQDLPDGNYTTARKFSSTQHKRNGFSILLKGLTNYRGWILGLSYGFCFGVELTTDNIIAQYFYDRFNLSIELSGAIASSFGLANIVSRPAGGFVSDRVGKRFGMRGRLWSLWVVQTMAGLLCMLLGRVNLLWASMVVMCVFSFFVQAASGLTFGVVPFVSKRSMGVISGMTGSGGTVGAVVTQLLLFSGTQKMSTETSISLMGIMMLVCSLPITLIYFPQWGGMFCTPSFHKPAAPDDDDDDDDDYHLLD